MKLRLRIDADDDDNVIQFLKSYYAYVLVHHVLPHGNPHYHAYAELDIKEPALRQRFKRKITKSTDYSIKKCDPDRINEYIQYMFNTKHGNVWQLSHIYNFDNQLITDLQRNAQQVTDNYAAIHKSKKNTGPTTWELALEVEHLFEERNNFDNNSQRYDSRITLYTDIAIEVLRKHHKAFDEFLLRKIITTAQSSTTKGVEILRYKMAKYFDAY